MEENVKQQAFREALDVNRDIYTQSRDGIDAEIDKLKQQKHLLFMDYRKRKSAIIKEFCQPTPESWAKRQRADAFQLQRIFGGVLNNFKSLTIDRENVSVHFDLTDETIEFAIRVPLIPFKENVEPDEEQA